MDRSNNPYIIPICTPITVSTFTPPLALSNGKSATMRVMHPQIVAKRAHCVQSKESFVKKSLTLTYLCFMVEGIWGSGLRVQGHDLCI